MKAGQADLRPAAPARVIFPTGIDVRDDGTLDVYDGLDNVWVVVGRPRLPAGL